jgi:hypothetical protein
MSQYSLDTLTQQKYLDKYENNILREFDDYWFENYLRVGSGIKDVKQLKHSLRLANVLDTENCTLINYIQDKIDGHLEDCGSKRKQFTDSIIQYNVIKPTTPPAEVATECCDWNSIEW